MRCPNCGRTVERLRGTCKLNDRRDATEWVPVKALIYYCYCGWWEAGLEHDDLWLPDPDLEPLAHLQALLRDRENHESDRYRRHDPGE